MRAVLPLLALAGLAPTAFAGEESVRSSAAAAAEAERLFAVKVLPLLERKCLGCHGGDEEDVRGAFDVRSREALLKGGESGEPALVPGDPAASPLFAAVKWEGLEMPPKESDRLTGDEIAVVERWIAAGAPWPDADRRREILEAERSRKVTDEGVIVETSGGLSDDWTYRRYPAEALWAYEPVEKPAVHTAGTAAANPIDAFVAARLHEANLAPAPPADPVTWLRRITFDLTGLPPTPGELRAFLADESPAAREAVVDRLLASPRYGERMAQHWLDVARYADTSGFSNDYERPNAWRYRDYVTRSFNADKPYDRFVIEQIAGDESNPDDPEMQIAVGFLRMGPWEHTAMSVAALTRQQFLDDVTNAVGETFLAHGLGCAKCHDHKFDPVPTRDYYAVQAVFASTRFDEPEVPFVDENTAAFEHLRAQMDARASDDDWLRAEDNGSDSIRRLNKKREEYLQRQRQRIEPRAFGVTSANADEVHVLTGGSLESPADPVDPGVLSAVSLGGEDPYAVPEQPSGRRLALAEWIADARNPLTARVIVNRVWQMHFGRGIVGTPNNFGRMGSRPTHPELLDWLAAGFVENGWSLKKLHRLIVTSETYARSSQHPDPRAVEIADPRNELLAAFPPRRLTAEELRDAMLAAAGQLRDEMGGPSIAPEINWEAALQPRHIMGAIAPSYVPSLRRQDRHRRTIYAVRIRTLADPLLEVFNRPGSDTSCERRDETTVTPQVFALFNNATIHGRALALADRLSRERDDLDGRIEWAFELLYCRPPSEAELAACRAHVERMTALHSDHQPPRTELPTWVEREMIDEQTGQPFRWSEKLDGMHDYERDLQPWETPPEVRGLAELCLVLLNSNEFAYVY